MEFKPNAWIVGVCLKLRFLKLATNDGNHKSIGAGTWVGATMQSVMTIIFSWLIANWCARTGFLNPSFDFEFDEWFLQGDGILVNVAILLTIFSGQLLRFTLWAANRYPLDVSIGKGISFLLAFAFMGITSVFLLSPVIEYPLWFNTPFDFSLFWVFLASAVFGGAGLVRGKKSVEDSTV